MADQESVGSFLMQVAKVATDSNEWTTQKQLQRLSRPGSKSVATGRIAFVDMFMFAPVQGALEDAQMLRMHRTLPVF